MWPVARRRVKVMAIAPEPGNYVILRKIDLGDIGDVASTRGNRASVDNFCSF